MKSHVLIAMKPVYYLHTVVFDILGAAAEIFKTFLHATEINLQFVFHFGKATLFCSLNVANTALCT